MLRLRATTRLLCLFPALALAACGGDSASAVLTVWYHTGQPRERAVIEDQVQRFDAAHPALRVELTLLPEGSYNAQLQAAAAAGELPDVLEVDGPYVYRYAWQGNLRALDGLLDDRALSGLLPSLRDQGTWRGRLYAVGTFDSGLGLWADRRALARAGIRIPKDTHDAWSADEFDALLRALARDDADGAVLDLKLNYPDEWFTYAFSPLLQSAGGDLIDRDGYRSAAGVLNGSAAVAAMSRVQDWLRAGRVDPNLDDAAFTRGRVALSWAGHWEYARYREALGDALVLLPLPDFGNGPRTGQGSWAWAVSRRSAQIEAAAAFIEFLLHPHEVAAMAEANGAVPGTRAAVQHSALYAPGGPLRLFVEQLDTIAVPRPKTPAYPMITSAFRHAFARIRDSADVQSALDEAVAEIDRDIRDNRGYAPAEAAQ